VDLKFRDETFQVYRSVIPHCGQCKVYVQRSMVPILHHGSRAQAD